ncbi:ribose ABC transporter [Paracoccus sp. 11-3]|uniref:Ribose ABC transporter n=1 Tax=Paracoccus amoyensis TaxID=2760093 RepID=A0A926JCX2_9RHOB|nr:RbsD/FucU domain-containing protein [Paracoccus amoyensis]MBC9246864.1 ribose ABC transporter [Paracoccus amoyensis]
MLKGIDPLIGPDLLRVLAQMGHGDEIVISDANFPSVSVASRTVHGKALRMDCDVACALRAVLSLLPIDTFQPEPVTTMQVVDDPQAVPDVLRECAPILTSAGIAFTAIERFAFYERASRAFAVLRTAEIRPYGNFILRKGIIV